MKLEESLNGNYASLYGEVVTEDIYHVRDLEDVVSINDPEHIHRKGHKRRFNFTPDTVIDLGANVGIFSRYAKSLWPDALVVSVEPNPANCAVFLEHTDILTAVLIQRAIGYGRIYQCKDAANGAMEVYLSEGPGYDQADLNTLKPTNVEAIMLTDLKGYVRGKTLLKIDIEGNETVIFNDRPSMALLKTFDYICMELHFYAADVKKYPIMHMKTFQGLTELAETHDTFLDNIYFYATKK